MIDGGQVKGRREAQAQPMSCLITLAFTPHLS